MNSRMDRREALRRLTVLSVAALVPASLLGCSRKTTCIDASGLAPEDANLRNNIAGYLDLAPDPGKKCTRCVQYVPAAPNACGSCKVVKGPVHPDGTCKLFVATAAS
jgi:hypothetical protein